MMGQVGAGLITGSLLPEASVEETGTVLPSVLHAKSRRGTTTYGYDINDGLAARNQNRPAKSRKSAA
jgi:hypothetical protein